MKQFLVALVVAVLKWVVDRFKPRVQGGELPGPREERLRDKVRKDGWK